MRQDSVSDPYDFNFYEQKPEAQCDQYTAFLRWVVAVIRPVLVSVTEPEINQAYLLLLQRYMDFYVSAPKKCRESVGSRGHRCIHHVLVETYSELRNAHLSLAPVPLPGARAVQATGVSGTLIGLPPVPEDEDA